MNILYAVKAYTDKLEQSTDAGSNSHLMLKQFFNEFGESQFKAALDKHWQRKKKEIEEGKEEKRRNVRAIFEDGNCIKTEINGSKEQIREYYLGKSFNFGIDGDKMSKCVNVVFMD